MTHDEALHEARRRFGPNATVRDLGPRYASSPEDRGRARVRLAELRGIKTDAMTTPQQYRHRNEYLRVFAATVQSRYSVGTVAPGAFAPFRVIATGDSWAEVFANADRQGPWI